MIKEIKLTSFLADNKFIPKTEQVLEFVNDSETLISVTRTIYSFMFEEEEYSIDGELYDSSEIPFSDYQLMEIETALAEIDLENLTSIKTIILSQAIEEDRVKQKMAKGFTRLVKTLRRIKVNSDEFIPFTTEEIFEFNKDLKVGLGDFLYAMTKWLSMTESYTQLMKENSKFVEIQTEVAQMCNMKNKDVLAFVKDCVELSRTTFITILDMFESDPDVWNKFINDVPETYVGDIMDLAEFVKLSDITDFNTGKLEITDSYIDLLKYREQQSISLGTSEEEFTMATDLFFGNDI